MTGWHHLIILFFASFITAYPSQYQPSCTVRNFSQPVMINHKLSDGQEQVFFYNGYMCSGDRIKGFIGTANPLATDNNKTDIVSIIIGSDYHTGDDIAMNCPRNSDAVISPHNQCYHVTRPRFSKSKRDPSGTGATSGGQGDCYITQVQPLGMRCKFSAQADDAHELKAQGVEL